jgi:hypothetical protein
MEIQQLLECLLAGQAKAEADREHDQEEIKAQIASLISQIDVNQAEMRSTVSALGNKMGALIVGMKDGQKETVVCQETSGGPYGRGCSEIFRNNEEAAQGLASRCRATHEAEETDLRRLWILGEVGCRLQEGVPPCSGMAEEEPFQEDLDPGKLWTVAGIGRRWNKDELLYRSRTVQGTRDPEATKKRDKTVEDVKGNNGTRRKDVKEPLHLKKGKKVSNSVGGWSRRQRLRLKSIGRGNKIYRKTIGLEVVK